MELRIKSTLDGTFQPSLFFEADNNNGKMPLLVGLHTWSFNRFNQQDVMLPFAKKLNWNLLLPDFRGSNSVSNINCKDACGSVIARQDIIDAVDEVVKNYKVNENEIFLLGASGGGHMALLTTSHAPKKWRAVAAFVPICDLEKWKEEKKNTKYFDDIVACVGNELVEYKNRSPINHIESISKATVKIFHGKEDDTVSFLQTMNFYNEIITKYPNSKTYLEIFEGGHELKMAKAICWFESQLKKQIVEETTG